MAQIHQGSFSFAAQQTGWGAHRARRFRRGHPPWQTPARLADRSETEQSLLMRLQIGDLLERTGAKISHALGAGKRVSGL